VISLLCVIRLHELERESQELASRAAMDRETLATLQGDLVTQKLNTQQLRSSLEKMELDLDQLMDPDVALEKYSIRIFHLSFISVKPLNF
jgi:hypothetical protein